MCDISVFMMDDGKTTLVMENVDEISVTDNEAQLSNIFGEVKILRAKISGFSNSEKKILLIPLA